MPVPVRTGMMSPQPPQGGGQFGPMPPMPLAGSPPPPMQPPMAQQGFQQQSSNAPRRKRFGDSLEGMLGRNVFAPQMPPPMMPRSMAMGGAVQYFANGGNANQQAAASMLSAGIGNVGGKAITSEAQDIQDRFSSAASRRKKRRRRRKARQEAERLAAEAAAAEAAALAASSSVVPEAFIPPSGGIDATPPGFGSTPPGALPSSPASGFASNLMNIEQPDRSIDAEIAGPSLTFDDDPAFTGALPPVPPQNYESTAAQMQRSEFGMPPVSPQNYESTAAQMQRSEFGMPIDPINLSQNIAPKADEIQDALSFAPQNYESTASQMIMNQPGISFEPSDIDPVTPIIREKDDSFAESMFVDEITNPYAVGGGFDLTAPRETDVRNQPLNRTGVDPQADQYRSSVNAAEAAFLQEALGQMKFNKEGNLVPADPNFGEQVLNKIIRNLTLGMFDPDDPQKRADAKAILDAYRQTGKFVYDSEGNAIDFSESLLGPDGKLDPDKLKAFDEKIKIFKGAGIEPAVIGVRDKEGNVVDFEDGTGFRNIMGDYNPVFSEDGQVFSGGSDTQDILTGDTDVFEDDTTTVVIDDDDGGSDTGTDTGTDTGVDTGHTVDEDGNIVCNTEGYIYNPETKVCEPPKEEEEDDGTPGSGINRGTSGESFEDVLKRVVVAAPDVAPISANVRPMQEGGMAGLNRAADNFLKALAG